MVGLHLPVEVPGDTQEPDSLMVECARCHKVKSIRAPRFRSLRRWSGRQREA